MSEEGSGSRSRAWTAEEPAESERAVGWWLRVCHLPVAPASNRASDWTSPRPLAAPVTIITLPLSEKSERGDCGVATTFSLFWVEVWRPVAGVAGWRVEDVLTRLAADLGERKLDGRRSLPTDLKQDMLCGCVVGSVGGKRARCEDKQAAS